MVVFSKLAYLASAVLASQTVAAKPGHGNGHHGLKWTKHGLRMNQVQIIGTHNSYHLEAPIEAHEAQAELLDNVINYYYSHPTLDRQATYQSVRNFELDLFADPEGGHYANPLVAQRTDTEAPPADIMNEPGVKVFHVSESDYWTTCYTLVACLQTVKEWSQQHPDHVPMPFMLEFKTASAEYVSQGGAAPIYWNSTELLDGLDDEIRSVFDDDQLITADHLRRDGLTLEESVLKYGWPNLDSARGRVFFLMDNAPGDIRDAYIEGRPSLEGRTIFTNSVPGAADCAFQKLNDPVGADNQAQIREAVEAGYWVRTRSDEPMGTILSDDPTGMRDAAFASGAQIVSTDFPSYGMTSRFHVDYAVRFDQGKAARCNPVTAPKKCERMELEPEEYVRH